MNVWCVLQTKVRREQLAESFLKQQGYDTRLFKTPTDKRMNPKETVEPLFPGYLFINMKQDSDWHTPIKTPGVIKFVRFGESPATLSDVVIDTLWQEEHLKYASDELQGYKTGDRVRIKTGPLKLLQGIVDKPQGERVRILMDVIGPETKIIMQYEDLEPVD